MSKYHFNPDRCKGALVALAALVNDHGNKIEREALDAICIDIEALHTAAQERDMALDIVVDLPTDEYGRVHDEDLDAFNWGWDSDHVDEDGKRIRIADLNL